MSAEKINEIRSQISTLRPQLAALQKIAPTERVANYRFKTVGDDTSLHALFDDKDSLFAIHNMGSHCPYCTLWADGLNGMAHHFKNAAAVVISSPDSPEPQETLRASRQWNFKMLSTTGNTFAEDMGYRSDHGYQPGVSVFKRDGDNIHRVSNTPFSPGDDFCAVWHLLDMLPEGADGWQPRNQYS